jgi:hypothetical protein
MNNDQKLADAILAMVQLSPGERATVMSVVERMRCTVTAVSNAIERLQPKMAEASEAAARLSKLANHCRPFSTEEREEILGYAWAYIESPSSAGRRKIYRDAAAKMGRSLESVKKAIRIARRELEGREPRSTQ